MKNIKKIMTAFLLLFSGYTAAATVTWGPATSNVNVNDVFTINVIGTGFLNNVDGGGVNISFDQNIINILSVTINESVWDFGGFGISTGVIDNLAGTLDGIMVNTLSNVSGDFTIATIQVQAIASGNGILSLAEYAGNPWASGGSTINPVFIAGAVNVAAVPLPAAAWLFGSGLIGLIGISKRRKTA